MASKFGSVVAARRPLTLQSPSFWLIIGFVVAPSLASYVLLRQLGEADPPLIDIYLPALLLVAALAGRARPRLATWLLALGVPLLLLVRIGWTVCAVYLEFADPATILGYGQFAGSWPWQGILLDLAPLVPIAWLCRGMARAVAWRSVSPAVLLAMLLVPPAAERLLPRPLLAGINLSGGHLHNVASAVAHAFGRAPFVATPVADPAQAAMLAAPGQRILSIGVESLGLPADRPGRDALARQLSGLFGPAYVAELRTAAARNSTLPGELRALCGVTVRGLPGPDDAARLAPGCVPARLAAAGWQTHGLHGNTGKFYGRAALYPRLGFGVTRFRGDFDARTVAPCPSPTNIGGWCDRRVMAEAMALLSGPGRRFVHVMSLDTHLPVIGDVPGCGFGGDLCRHGVRMRQSLSAMAAAVAAADAAPDLIVLWGDHPPPFLNGDSRAAFDHALVPVVIYRRR